MLSQLKTASVLFILLTVITGLAYPLLVTGIAQLLFPQQANGSLSVDKTAKALGSKLIGQAFSDPKYFWGRPSATAPFPYNAGASAGSNQGPTNPVLVEIVKTRIQALQGVDPEQTKPVPIDLVTASASGLDPHISPAAAAYQAARIAPLRGIPVTVIESLVRQATEDRQWGWLGERRVNVLRLNRSLDAKYPISK
jgi:potassium-transporting ATPase KdpC subunit